MRGTLGAGLGITLGPANAEDVSRLASNKIESVGMVFCLMMLSFAA